MDYALNPNGKRREGTAPIGQHRPPGSILNRCWIRTIGMVGALNGGTPSHPFPESHTARPALVVVSVSVGRGGVSMGGVGRSGVGVGGVGRGGVGNRGVGHDGRGGVGNRGLHGDL